MTRRGFEPLVRRALADLDVHEALDFYLSESAAAASEFLDALEVAYEGIRRSPGIGAPRYAHELNLPGLRFWRCGRYSYLVFYIEQADRIDLLRVLHQRRDIAGWLLDDDGPPTAFVNEP